MISTFPPPSAVTSRPCLRPPPPSVRDTRPMTDEEIAEALAGAREALSDLDEHAGRDLHGAASDRDTEPPRAA